MEWKAQKSIGVVYTFDGPVKYAYRGYGRLPTHSEYKFLLHIPAINEINNVSHFLIVKIMVLEERSRSLQYQIAAPNQYHNVRIK